jgi:hypothetical protein
VFGARRHRWNSFGPCLPLDLDGLNLAAGQRRDGRYLYQVLASPQFLIKVYARLASFVKI